MSTSTVNKEFILKGKAIFSVVATKGDEYTFKVTKKRTKNWGTVFYVATLSSPGNKGRFAYLGVLSKETGAIKITPNSKYHDQSRAVLVARFICTIIWRNMPIPEGYVVGSV